MVKIMKNQIICEKNVMPGNFQRNVAICLPYLHGNDLTQFLYKITTDQYMKDSQ